MHFSWLPRKYRACISNWPLQNCRIVMSLCESIAGNSKRCQEQLCSSPLSPDPRAAMLYPRHSILKAASPSGLEEKHLVELFRVQVRAEWGWCHQTMVCFYSQYSKNLEAIDLQQTRTVSLQAESGWKATEECDGILWKGGRLTPSEASEEAEVSSCCCLPSGLWGLVGTALCWTRKQGIWMSNEVDLGGGGSGGQVLYFFFFLPWVN